MDAPLISILIPIRNEAEYIKRCLDAVLAQDYPRDRMEILIADGISTDGTRTIIQNLQAKHPHIQIFDNPGKVVPSGLNILIPQAKGDILIRVDGHCIIAPDYVRNCVVHIQNEGVDGVGGPMQSIGEDHISQVIALAMSSKFGVGGSSFRTETGRTKLVDTVPFPAYNREIIKRAGHYDEELVRNQDDEYNYRIRKAGGKILLAADVRSTYFSRGSLKKLWGQYFQYGFYKVRVLQKHPKQMRPRQFVPPAFVAGVLSLIIISMFFPWGWIALFSLLSIYLIINLLASMLVAKDAGWRYLPLLPLAFSTLHISYGAGFLAGLVKFWKRWKE